MKFLFYDVLGDGYCFYHSILQDVLLQQRFGNNVHALRLHMKEKVFQHELFHTFIGHLFAVYGRNFGDWSSSMQICTPSLPIEHWPISLDYFLFILLFNRDIVIVSRCPLSMEYVSRSYFDELQRMINGYKRRFNCSSPTPLQLEGLPIYVLYHTQGDLNSYHAYNHFGYLKKVDGFISESPSNPFSVPNSPIHSVTPQSSPRRLDHNEYSRQKRNLQNNNHERDKSQQKMDYSIIFNM